MAARYAQPRARTPTRTIPKRQPMFQRMRATSVSLPAPVGGWNARDSIAAMDPQDAVTLTNLFPGTTSVNARLGFTKFSTGYSAQVETVMAYAGSTTAKLKAIAGGGIYDATSGGAIGAAEVSGLTNSRWQYVNLTTAGGSFLEMVNGADGVYTYNGANWVDQSGSISGVTASNLTNINVFKNRLWFTEVGTLKAWYLPTQSITGAANALDLSAFCPHGGYLMAMGTWTVDAGYGVDDLAVFITNFGDTLVYRGTDPSSASTWALVGVWWLGSPVGRRCFIKWKGDLLLICQDGLLPMSGALQSSRVNPRVALTDKIQSKMSGAVSTAGSNFGWQVLPYPKQNMLILNVPFQTGNSQQQYVMNTITGAWCNFTNWWANCFELFNDDLYFGGSNYVARAWNTNLDAGSAIFIDGLQAFNNFGSDQQKRFTMIRPILFINSTEQLNANINVDFDQTAPASAIGTTSFTGSLWDTGKWDTAEWSSTLSVSELWQGATGVGRFGAPHIQADLDGASLQWVGTTVVLEPGAIV